MGCRLQALTATRMDSFRVLAHERAALYRHFLFLSLLNFNIFFVAASVCRRLPPAAACLISGSDSNVLPLLVVDNDALDDSAAERVPGLVVAAACGVSVRR